MNLDAVRKWVDALRSGDYKQGQGFLRKDDKFCCLGVLCEVAAKEGVIEPAVEHDYNPGVFSYGGATMLMPMAVRAWAQADSGPGVYVDDVPVTPAIREVLRENQSEEVAELTETVGLVSLNDAYGQSFDQIADAIENAWLKAGAMAA